MSKTALAIPEVSTPIPAGWWESHVLPNVDAMNDADDVAEDVRRLAALAKYVKDHEQRFELDAARIVAEMRIGELLPKEVGGRGKVRTYAEVSPDDASRFRLLAKHRKLVLELLRKGIASRRRILARISAPPPVGRPEGIEVRLGDFREVLADLDSAVDAIVTDPPYPREFLPLFSDLSEMAAKILRPGGVCIVMSGQSYLPEVIERLGEHLDYRWICAYLTPGAATSLYQRRVATTWKPLLVYERSPANANHRIGVDVLRAPGGDTDPTYHGWGQNELGMLDIINRLTSPGDLIVDPFLGGGTTLVAAAQAGRSAIGCDVDPAAVAAANERLG